MSRLGSRSAVLVLLFWGTAWAATASLPRGKRSARKAATQVVVRTVDLDAQGVPIRLAPGVAVSVAGGRIDAPVSGRVVATLVGGAELTGRIDGAALGERLARTVELRAVEGGAPIGEGREGGLVTIAGRTADGAFVCDTVGPVRARVTVPANALTAEPRELVFPVVNERLGSMSSEADLLTAPAGRPRARLARGARVVILAQGDARWARVRTYGAFAIEGFVAKERLGSTDGAPPLEDPVPRGLTPTHEVLVEAPATADSAGRKSIGTLRGGTLVSMGVEVAGPRIKVMTYGDVVGEIWVPSASLRTLEREIWNEHD